LDLLQNVYRVYFVSPVGYINLLLFPLLLTFGMQMCWIFLSTLEMPVWWWWGWLTANVIATVKEMCHVVCHRFITGLYCWFSVLRLLFLAQCLNLLSLRSSESLIPGIMCRIILATCLMFVSEAWYNIFVTVIRAGERCVVAVFWVE